MRIWVTGVGVISPLGRSAGQTMDALLAGKRAFAPLMLFDPAGCRSTIAAEVVGVSAEIGWSRTDALALAAAREALAAAEVPADGRTDLIVGGTTAGMFETEDLLAEMHADPAAWRSAARGSDKEQRIVCHPLSATVDRLMESVGPFGSARTICSACSSGANAILLAAAWLRTGRSERVLAGGADALCRLTYTGFSCLGALSAEPCRPFDRDRDGLNLGEGAAFLVLETEAAGRARGADPVAELRGWAVGAEAHHITNPEASGATAAEVMARALRRAKLAPDDIDYVNAHGTATKLNDAMESTALRRVLGWAGERVAVSSTKGQIGHTLGAAGAVEAAVTVMAIARGVMPPTAGLENVDPECALDHVTSAREAPVRAAMSNSFGFGGSDAVLVFAEVGRFSDGEAQAPRPVYVAASATVGPLGAADARASAGYLEAGPPPAAGATAFEAGEHLDLGKARRMDRAGRLCAAAMKLAMGDGSGGEGPRAGAIMGGAFGSVDACAAFIARFFEKGAKLASPAVFPNLLPSSAVAHASIYHGLRGPVFATADLQATALGALVTAVELIAADEADLMFAGGIEESGAISEVVLGPLCSGKPAAPPRSEGSAVLRLEAHARGAIARVGWWTSWRGAAGDRLRGAPRPPERALVACASAASCQAALAGSAWEGVALVASQPRAGSHECAAGMAAAAAVGRLALGLVDAAMVLEIAPDRGYALVLERLGARP